MERPIYTIGHSTRTLEDLTRLLAEHDVELLADIRAHPGSRRLPHVAREVLSEEMPKVGISYLHLPELGGRRRSGADSINQGWRNPSFRAYADYMQQPVFWDELDRLLGLAATRTTAIMCAEAVPWRCHRSLVADAILVRGTKVIHILGPGSTSEHALTPFARSEPGRLYYPAPEAELHLRRGPVAQ